MSTNSRGSDSQISLSISPLSTPVSSLTSFSSSEAGSSNTMNTIRTITKGMKLFYQNLTTSEISGSLGDLGTLLPLLVALSSQRSIQLAPALFFGGLSNLITGLTWDVPMCVQPMKSIAAVALSENWSSGSVTAAGFLTGGAVFLLGVSNFIEVVNKVVPGNVVSGLQIGVGINLASKGVHMVGELGWVSGYDCILLGVLCAMLCLFWLKESVINIQNNSSQSRRRLRLRHRGRQGDGKERDQEEEQEIHGEKMEERDVLGNASRDERIREDLTTFTQKIISCCMKPFTTSATQKQPVGIYLFIIGVIFAVITLATTKNENNQYDLPLQFFGAPVVFWAMGDVTAKDYWTGFTEGMIPQLPLTTLNSVISVCALAHSLYPEKRRRNHLATSNDAVISRREVAISVGLINLLFCPFGSMPNCHGAGGLAGQHRLGARHGASVVFLGIGKILLAVFLGKSALTLLDAFPLSVLGVMLAIAGQELATTGFTLLVKSVEDEVDNIYLNEVDVEDPRIMADISKLKSHMLRQNTVIATITALVIISTGKTHYGALSGWVSHMIYGGGLSDVKSWCRSRRYSSAGDGQFKNGKDQYDTIEATTGSQ